jgi:hypothetical protein
MSTKIQRDFAFQAGVHYDNKFLMNLYSLSLIIYVEINCPKEQNIAMERIKHFLLDCLENSVFVNEKEKRAIDKYIDANIKVCTLPNEPYDQVVMQALLLKLNSITEGRFVVTEIILSSKMSDGVKFFGDIEVIDEEFAKNDGWWFNPNTCISNFNKINKKEKIVKLHAISNDWDQDLLWEIKTDKTTVAEILFTNPQEKTPV